MKIKIARNARKRETINRFVKHIWGTAGPQQLCRRTCLAANVMSVWSYHLIWSILVPCEPSEVSWPSLHHWCSKRNSAMSKCHNISCLAIVWFKLPSVSNSARYSKQCCRANAILFDLYKWNPVIFKYVASVWYLNELSDVVLLCSSLAVVYFISALLSFVLDCLHLEPLTKWPNIWMCSTVLYYFLLPTVSRMVAGVLTPAQRCMIWNSSQQWRLWRVLPPLCSTYCIVIA